MQVSAEHSRLGEGLLAQSFHCYPYCRDCLRVESMALNSVLDTVLFLDPKRVSLNSLGSAPRHYAGELCKV